MKPKSSLLSFLALSGSALLTISIANAASGDWTYDGGTAGNLLWSSATSWSSNPTVPGTAAGDVITFTNNITGNRIITIDDTTTRTVGSLTIGDSNNTHGFTIARAGTGNLVFEASSGDAQLVENGSVNDTITTTITLNSNLDITANGSLTLGPANGGIIATNKTITKLGAGSLTISGNQASNLGSTNNFDVQAGTLIYNNANALGSAAINLNGGNLDATSIQNGITANAAVHGWNSDWAWGGSASTFSLGSGAVTLGAPTVQVTVTQNQLTVGGAIGDTGAGRGLTKAGIGTLVLGAANTYTGTTTVTGGALRLAGDTSLAGGIGVSGGGSALTLNGGVVELGASNFARNLGSGASQFQITGGTSGFSSFGSAHSVTVNDNAGQEVQWGSASFMPGTLVLNDTTANAGLDFRNRLDLNGADRTINVNANTAVISGDIRTSTGTAGLIKGGAGTLALTGTNTYNGATTVNAGVLSVGRTANLSGYDSSGKVVFNGGTVRVAVGGSGWTTGEVDTLLSNATKTSGAIGLDTSSGNLTQWTTFTGGGNFGALGLEKSGSNALTLNQVNSYTGATTISGGTLRIQNSTGLAQTLSGGLNIAGPDVTIHSDYNGGSGTLSTTFGALTRTAGSTVNFSVTGGTPGVNNLVNLTGSAGFVDIGAHYNGTDFAWRDSGNGFVRAAVYGTDVGTSAANALTASTHALVDSNLSLNPGGNRTVSSLKITNGADLTFTSSARLITSAIVASGGDSVINLGGAQVGGGAELVIRVDGIGDQLTIPATITTANLVKSGAGKLVITTTSANTGTTFVNGGTLELQGNYTAPSIDIAKGATLLYNSSGTQTFGVALNSGTISGGGNLVKNGTGTLTISSPTSFTGTTTVSGGIIQLANSYALSGSTLDTANSVAGTSSVGLRISNGISNMTLGGLSGDKNMASTGGVFSTTNGNYGNISALTLNPDAGITSSYSGTIENGAANMTLTKTGSGTQILSGTSTYTGATLVSAGTLLVNGSLGASAVTVNSGAFGGSGTIGSTLDLVSGSFHVVDLLDALQVTGTVTLYAGFGIDDLAGLTWESVSAGTYTLIDGTLGAGVFDGLAHNSLASAYDLGGGKKAYFQEGSLQLVVIPEPRAALLGGLGLLMLLRRRRD